MFAQFLLVSASLLTTTVLVTQDADQSLRMSSNGEFIAKHFPPRALVAGEEGKVEFQLVVQPDGSLGTCEVTVSSGYKSLDNETCELILRYARMPPVRNSEGRAVRAVQNGFINWKNPRGAGQVTAVRTAAVGELPDKIVCKKSPTTGSLIKRTKQCMSARQWGEAERIAKESAHGVIAKGFTSVCGPSGNPECT
jgi:periplasmic protein TonB